MSDAAVAIGRHVLVTGLAGSGKSTFSGSLAARTGLPVIHLDLHFWKPGWVAPSEDEWREKQRRVLAGDAWIADGNYHETLDLRLERADTIVVLDTPCSRRLATGSFRLLPTPVGETVARSPNRVPNGYQDKQIQPFGTGRNFTNYLQIRT